MARIGLEHERTWLVRLAEWGSRRKYGKGMDRGRAALHNRRVMASMLLLEGAAARWKGVDPGLKGRGGGEGAGSVPEGARRDGDVGGDRVQLVYGLRVLGVPPPGCRSGETAGCAKVAGQ